MKGNGNIGRHVSGVRSEESAHAMTSVVTTMRYERKRMEKSKMTIKQMQAEIAKLTQRACISTDRKRRGSM